MAVWQMTSLINRCGPTCKRDTINMQALNKTHSRNINQSNAYKKARKSH